MTFILECSRQNNAGTYESQPQETCINESIVLQSLEQLKIQTLSAYKALSFNEALISYKNPHRRNVIWEEGEANKLTRETADFTKQ